MRVQAEVSLYPLRTGKLSEPISAFCRSLDQEGLSIESGPMSTRISGECGDIFTALQRAFSETAQDYQTVLLVKMSNACPDRCTGETEGSSLS